MSYNNNLCSVQKLAFNIHNLLEVFNTFIRESYDLITHGDQFTKCPSQIFDPNTCIVVKNIYCHTTPAEQE